MKPKNIAVEFRSVGFRWNGGQTVLSHLSFQVFDGETLVLLGRSGCGKTTTLKLVNRLLTPTEGSIWIEGKAASEWDPIRLRRRIGYVIQEVGLFPHFTVEENVALVPSLEGWDLQHTRMRVCEMLSLVGLPAEKFARRFPKELSGGQRQRVGLARALAADPPYLLMDEPFGALDPVTRREIQQEFCDLKKRLHKTILFVTHDIQEAFLLASRIALMKEGRIVALGSPGELQNSPHPEAAAFLKL